jgi:hypothetical protein
MHHLGHVSYTEAVTFCNILGVYSGVGAGAEDRRNVAAAVTQLPHNINNLSEDHTTLGTLEACASFYHCSMH